MKKCWLGQTLYVCTSDAPEHASKKASSTTTDTSYCKIWFWHNLENWSEVLGSDPRQDSDPRQELPGKEMGPYL
jgi:hypothetical protein